MEVCTIGEKVYWDTFAGMLKGIVTDIKPYHPKWQFRLFKGNVPDYWELTIKITSKNNPCYRLGEIQIVNSTDCIPRRFYHKTGIFRYVVYPDYIWQKG